MWAYLFLASKRHAREDKRTLRLHALAARGDMKQVTRELKERDDR
jgi:hypothetical protein